MLHTVRNPPSSPRERRALSVTETVVTIAILLILITLTAGAISSTRRSRARSQCATNLHNIGTAFAIYLTDHNDVYPAPSPTAQWEDQLRPYVSRNTFHCPADYELFAVLGSSYNWRDTGDPSTTLAGMPAVRVLQTSAALAFDAFPGWHAAGKVQVLKADNSQELMTQADFFRDLQRSPTIP